jgi:hypothetical protein
MECISDAERDEAREPCGAALEVQVAREEPDRRRGDRAVRGRRHARAHADKGATQARGCEIERLTLTRGNGTVRSYGYDAVSRLASLAEDLSGTTYDQTLSFTHNVAGQIATNTRSNDLYAWTGHYNVNRNYTANGLNQYTASGAITPTYDTKGNLTSAGSVTYAYSSENMLTSASGGITLAYDPALRLYQIAG